MIKFLYTLTPIPHCPGYFWDTVEHRLYSIKVGGVLREMSCRVIHPCLGHRGLPVGESYYRISVNGRPKIKLARDLKKLELVDYDMPVIKKVKEVTT